MSLPYDPVAIWALVKEKTGKTACDSHEFFAALAQIGYSEGAWDGILDTIRASAVCEVDDEWNFTERTGQPTKFVFCCDLCGGVIGVAQLKNFGRAALNHRAKPFAGKPTHPPGKLRYHCLSQPRRVAAAKPATVDF